ncbi:MAG: GGDEF domain-containing protein [Ponticaulis sp.]|nr:GGDEF domain-containing protein [Ponticaulis sp.]
MKTTGRLFFTFTFLVSDKAIKFIRRTVRMKFGELTGRAGRETGHRAIDGVIDLDLSASPQNYELWLHYQNNWTPGLNDEIDELLSDDGHLDEKCSETLYDKYFNSSRLSAHVAQTGARLATELTAALHALNLAGSRTEEFNDCLDSAASELREEQIDSSRLIDIVTTLSRATHEMSEQNSELTRKLEESSSEINELRTHLESIRTESLTDSLTGIANRKQFDNMLRFRIQESRSLNYPLSLAICDIDHFKGFNDAWGHQTGDQVIRFVAATLDRLALKDHLVARYGGEEFVIIMPRVTINDAIPTLERMRRAIEVKKLKRKSTGDCLGNVTISMGVTELLKSDSSSTFIRRADEHLYAAKRSGRNRVVSDHPARSAA